MRGKIKMKLWWLLFAVGLLLLAAGIFALANPFHAFFRAVNYSGLALIANGLVLAVLSGNTIYKFEKNWLLSEATADFIFAMLMLFNPLFTFLVLPLLVSGWLFIIGAIKIFASIRLRKYLEAWPLVLVLGFISISFSLLLWNNPIEKASGDITIIGVFCFFIGCFNIIDAIRYKNNIELSMMF
jgi:uncharacterized membrane protein HdeD (DUF308 family)